MLYRRSNFARFARLSFYKIDDRTLNIDDRANSSLYARLCVYRTLQPPFRAPIIAAIERKSLGDRHGRHAGTRTPWQAPNQESDREWLDRLGAGVLRLFHLRDCRLADFSADL